MTQFARMIIISGLAGVFTTGLVWLAWDFAERVQAEMRARAKDAGEDAREE